MNANRLLSEWEGRFDMAEYVPDLVRSGKAEIETSFDDKQLQRLRAEARLVPQIIRRTIPEWERTERATLFARPQGLKELLLSARMMVPAIYSAGRAVELQLRTAAEAGPMPLTSWQINRVGINYMHGEENKPAQIPNHTDPSELHGVVAVLNLSESLGRLTLYACADTCQAMGVKQVEHATRASFERTTVTYGQLQKA